MMRINTAIQIFTLLACTSKCLCFKFRSIEFNKDLVYEHKTLSEFLNNIENTARRERSKYLMNTKIDIEKNDLPGDCSQREKLNNQPQNNQHSRLKKCCPHGEGLTVFRDNQSEQLCDSTDHQFNPSIVNVILFDNCIEDAETEVHLPLDIGNPCNASLIYNDNEDSFFVLQDGSLLIMDKYGNDSYTVEKRYCLDMDNISGTTYAIICITSIEEHLNRSEIVTVAVLTLVSIPCLFLVSYLHLALTELRTLHGLSLSLMSLCLATGYLFHSFVYIFNINSSNFGYAIQFFILSYFFWFFCLCCNVLQNIWYRIPMNKNPSKFVMWCIFAVYFIISCCWPILLVVLTIQKGLPGMPSYFIQGFTASIRESQRYFIPPVSSVLLASFIVMVTSFFGFQRIKKRGAVTKGTNCIWYININLEIDEMKYEEVKKDAKCISFLGVIMIITWLLEVVTFYSPGPESYLIIMEIINALQGVFILLIFVVVRRRRTIILRWWYDRGSHNIEDMELQESRTTN